jgi:hypothetical protein
MIKTKWRILVGSIFATHETLWIEPPGVRKHRRIAVSLAHSRPRNPAFGIPQPSNVMFSTTLRTTDWA